MINFAEELNIKLGFVFDPEKFPLPEQAPCEEETRPPSVSLQNMELASLEQKRTLMDFVDDKSTDVVLVSSDGKEIPTFRCVLSKFTDIFDKVSPTKIHADFEAKTIVASLDFCFGKTESIFGKETKCLEFANKYAIADLKVSYLYLLRSHYHDFKCTNLNFSIFPRS